MIIAQLSDLHALPEGGRLGGVDTNALLVRAVDHVNRLNPEPNLVLITGDLVESGSPAGYQALRQRLAELRLPYYLCPGNHDRRAPLVEALADRLTYLPKTGHIHYTVEEHPVRLVVLDTLAEGRPGAQLCPARVDWLAETLAAQPDRPTLIAMHHPPFMSGIGWMDAGGFEGLEAFEDVLERNPQVVRIVCGHLHRPITATIGTATVSVSPSTCYQVHLDLVPKSPPQIIFEPPACQLHLWDGRRFISHTSYIESDRPAIDISKNVGKTGI